MQMNRLTIMLAAYLLISCMVLGGCSDKEESSYEIQSETETSSQAEDEKNSKEEQPETVDITEYAQTGVIYDCQLEDENASEFFFKISSKDSAKAFEDIFGDDISNIFDDADFNNETILIRSFSSYGDTYSVGNITSTGDYADMQLTSAGDGTLEEIVYNYAYAVIPNEKISPQLNGWFSPQDVDFSKNISYGIVGNVKIEDFNFSDFESVISQVNAYTAAVYYGFTQDYVSIELETVEQDQQTLENIFVQQLKAEECELTYDQSGVYFCTLYSQEQNLSGEFQCNLTAEGSQQQLENCKEYFEQAVGEDGWLEISNEGLTGKYYNPYYGSEKFSDVYEKTVKSGPEIDNITGVVYFGYIKN